MNKIAKISQPHHWSVYPKKERDAKKMPKHFRGHNPKPVNQVEIFKGHKDFTPETKCKLYITRRQSPYNDDVPIETHVGVKLKNINRVLSACNRSRQQKAFAAVRTASGTYKTINLYEN